MQVFSAGGKGLGVKDENCFAKSKKMISNSVTDAG